ncbi:hypothetical protein ACFS5N_14875 [Mucilaginibacter ximonensis]|uniref:Lipoprotein n=1 Tax=Mucilaginibacter ximonensis TaxID=538021 RepID=A0ABW5YG37_9SPHI
MKTLTISLIGACVLLGASACEHSGRHVVIKSGDSYNTVKIEYYGRAVFDREGTTILHISPNGSVEYSSNGDHLLAEGDQSGNVTYSINGGEKEKQLNKQEKALVANAVKVMIKHGHNDD